MSREVHYSTHFRDFPEGHIYINKEDACTITLTGAASMTQEELDTYGKVFAEALEKFFADKELVD